MSADRSSWLQRVEALTDRFIPAAVLARSPEDARQARFAVALAWGAAVIFALATVAQRHQNSRAVLALNAFSALLCLAAPFVMRRIGRPALVCHGVLAVSFCKYVSIALFLRGAGLSGATVFLAQIPLVATFLTGIRPGAIWALLSLLAGITLGLLGHAGLIVDHLPPANHLFNDHFALAISTAILFLIAAFYERSKAAVQQHIYDLEAQRQAAELERVKAVTRAQLADAERLASLGRVAAATAHEINNPLSAVLANLALVAESPTAGAASPLIRDAWESAERIRRIVAALTQWSQPPVTGQGTVEVEAAIDRALKLAEPHTRARVRVERKVAAALPSVVGDAARLSQVLLNLLVNAAEAIPEGQAAKHRLVVEARVDEQWVVIEVSNTGRGISPALFDKVKEPFFTVKPTDDTLGLALCEGILQSFGGQMTLESRHGETVVRLALVVAPSPAASAATPLAPSSALSILIVDDEEIVARTLGRMLKGHSVMIAGGGRQALEILGEQKRFDFIFCDLMMPDLTGMDLFERVHSSDPELGKRIVFMTGGTFTTRANEFRQTVPNMFLQKPFDLATVRGIVKAYLDAQAGVPAP